MKIEVAKLRKTNKVMGTIALTVFLAIVFASAFLHSRWRYRQCRQMGGSVLYCLDLASK